MWEVKFWSRGTIISSRVNFQEVGFTSLRSIKEIFSKSTISTLAFSKIPNWKGSLNIMLSLVINLTLFSHKRPEHNAPQRLQLSKFWWLLFKPFRLVYQFWEIFNHPIMVKKYDIRYFCMCEWFRRKWVRVLGFMCWWTHKK